SSLAKLSIGKRVVSARDDAASQAVVNAGQANSMLQIADGAMSTISDILTRMKVLAMQAGSENLGATERGFLAQANPMPQNLLRLLQEPGTRQGAGVRRNGRQAA
ncbi:MAG TPA: hypothetical protein VLE23_16700, partial [Geminicoccaceae bacterium]|nr:hypothetical protein [Geminicoccaceae bacterium]